MIRRGSVKLRRVTAKAVFMVVCLTLASLAFIVAGVLQYSDAAHVCNSASETLQGNSCVSVMGDGSNFALDKSSEISGDHIGGIVLMVIGLLGFVFGLVASFSMWNFVADRRDERLAAAEVAAAAGGLGED